MRTIIEMAKEAGLTIRGHYDESGSTPQELERFAALVREDDAKFVEGFTANMRHQSNEAYNFALECAAALRSRK